MKCLMHRMSPKPLAKWKHREFEPMHRVDPDEVAALFASGLVGWFLDDTPTHLRLRARFAPTTAKAPPPFPSGWGPEWKAIFETVRHRFRRALEAHGEGDPWVSYGLSYEALRRRARKGRHGEMAYVHRACVNAHKKYRNRLARQRGRSLPGGDLAPAGVPPEPVDLVIDLEDLLRRLPAGDAAVCRLQLVEGRTFREIGEGLGLAPATACRRFDRRIGAIRVALSEYGEDPNTVRFTASAGSVQGAA